MSSKKETPKNQAKEINTEKGSGKTALRPRVRLVALIVGVLMVIAGGIGGFHFSRPYEDEVKRAESDYTIATGGDYQIHLKPNPLFDSEWRPEGFMYSSLLTDLIEVDFRSDVKLNKPATISGEYTIEAVIEYYQLIAEIKKIINISRYPLKSGQFDEAAALKHQVQDKIQIQPAQYREFALQADQILGGKPVKDFYLLFKGTMSIDDKKEEEFAYRIALPVGDDPFYYVKKQDGEGNNSDSDQSRVEKTGNFGAESDKVLLTPPLKNYLPFVIIGIVGLLILSFVVFFTKELEGEALWESNLAQIMRRYGSRMVGLEELPQAGDRQVLRLYDILSLVALAEELREPVLYRLAENNLPSDGTFCVLGSECMYLLRFDRPTTTLAVDPSTPLER